MKYIKKYSLYIALALAIFILDQYSKYLVANSFYLGESINIIDGFLNFTYAHNKGVAFSFGDGFSETLRLVLFKILPIFVCLFVLRLFWDAAKERNKLQMLAYTFILGGALGNIVDRIRLDYVVDFIAVYSRGLNLGVIELPSWHFAIFNIADSAVSIAIALLILDYFLAIIRKKNAPSL